MLSVPVQPPPPPANRSGHRSNMEVKIYPPSQNGSKNINPLKALMRCMYCYRSSNLTKSYANLLAFPSMQINSADRSREMFGV